MPFRLARSSHKRCRMTEPKPKPQPKPQPKPTLKSSDFDSDQKSFTLGTDDGYFIRPTAVYVKGMPALHAEAVTVIVWFHDFYVNNRQTLFKDTPGMEVKLLENLRSCAIKDLIFIAPWMGYVQEKKEVVPGDDGQPIPKKNKDGTIKPGEFVMRNIGSPQYKSLEAHLGKAADDYLKKILEGLANFVNSKGQALKDSSDGKPAKAFTIKNLILACHSGGGMAMRAFVKGLGSGNTSALKGCWCFDCLYSGDDPTFWFNRGKTAPPFYEYYCDTEHNAKSLLKLMGHPKEDEFSADGSNLNVIDYSAKDHYRTASEGFPERLKKIKLD
jgi:hypothetical protein